jgi:hypothetical protein
MQKTQEKYFNMAVCHICNKVDFNIKKWEWHYIPVRPEGHIKNSIKQVCPDCWRNMHSPIGRKGQIDGKDAIIKDKVGNTLYIQFKDSLVQQRISAEQIDWEDDF